MQIDPVRAIGAVSREVRSLEHEGRQARVVVATRTYPTTVDDLWDALTNKERIPRWFLTISGDLRLGGRYQLQGNAGGVITRCEAPHTLGLTWEYAGAVSWVTVRLRSTDAEEARLELEHVAHVGDDLWDQFGPGAVGVGWDLALMGLGNHLATGAAMNAEEAGQWTASDEGKTFMRLSSTDWGRASVASGTPEAEAMAAVARTSSAYTGDA